MSTRVTSLACLTVTVLTLAGCSDQEAAHQVAGTPSRPSVDRATQLEEVERAEDRQAECMAERGFPARIGANGLPEYPAPSGPGNDQAIVEALSECFEQSDFPAVETFSEAEWHRLYPFERERITCFEQHGVTITQELPSEESYVAMQQQPLAKWDPLKDAVIPHGIDLLQLQLDCPIPGLRELGMADRGQNPSGRSVAPAR